MTITRVGSKGKRQRISLSRVFCSSIIKKSICALSLLYAGHSYAQENPWAQNFKKDLPPVADVQKGVWLKGELHLHSSHSTDASNNSIEKIKAFCARVGMDFVAITDHDNHVKGAVAKNTWADPAFKNTDNLLILYGAEWTTTRGHGNVFSAKPYDHQRLYDIKDQRDIVIQAVKNNLGIHLSANHPIGKDHFGFSYDLVKSIEVWSAVTANNSEAAMMVWDDLLSSGRRLTGRGGSDAHHGRPEGNEKPTKSSIQAEYNYIGTPTNWVFSQDSTAQGVIDALDNGRVSVSMNPYAPRVEFYADQDRNGQPDAMMGDNLKASDTAVDFMVRLSGKLNTAETYTVQVIKNGRPFQTLQLKGSEGQVKFTDIPVSDDRSYYRVIVEGKPVPYAEVPKAIERSGNMLALSNPIYFNFDPDF